VKVNDNIKWKSMFSSLCEVAGTNEGPLCLPDGGTEVGAAEVSGRPPQTGDTL